MCTHARHTTDCLPASDPGLTRLCQVSANFCLFRTDSAGTRWIWLWNQYNCVPEHDHYIVSRIKAATNRNFWSRHWGGTSLRPARRFWTLRARRLFLSFLHAWFNFCLDASFIDQDANHRRRRSRQKNWHKSHGPTRDWGSSSSTYCRLGVNGHNFERIDKKYW